jgi:hypothetical protein
MAAMRAPDTELFHVREQAAHNDTVTVSFTGALVVPASRSTEEATEICHRADPGNIQILIAVPVGEPSAPIIPTLLVSLPVSGD